jgi:hypothetical protein
VAAGLAAAWSCAVARRCDVRDHPRRRRRGSRRLAATAAREVGYPIALTFSAQQIAEAKSKACEAFEKAQKASRSNLGRSGGDDPNAQLLVAVNMRQVFMSSSVYLLKTLAAEPAAPADLAVAVKKLSDLLQVITLDGLAGDPNDSGHNAVNETGHTIQNLCK